MVFPAVLYRPPPGWVRALLVNIPFGFGALAVVSRFYVESQRALYEDWRTTFKYIPLVIAFGMGLSLNNARGVMEALIGRESAFLRTPKFSITGGDGQDRSWSASPYAASAAGWGAAELAIGCAMLAAAVTGVHNQAPVAVPFLLLFSTGFLYVGWTSWRHALHARGTAAVRRVAEEA